MSNIDQSPQSATADVSALDEEPLPTLVGSFDDLQRHRGAAGAVPLAAIRSCRFDVDLAAHNALRGRDAIRDVRANLEAIQHPLDWSRVDSLDSLCRAVAYTADRAGAYPRPTGEILALLREARPLRRLLLSSATTHSLAGRCPTSEVERIARGRGAFDTAIDLVDLAFVHTEHGLFGGNTAVSEEQVRRAKTLGTDLRERLRPSGAPRPTITRDQRDAAVLRDRLWTVLLLTYEDIERAAGALWGAQLRQHLPSIRARHVPRKRDRKPAVPGAPTG